jgi:heme/copper-type cytochrome/quinol oxidase subunit 1
MGLRKIKVYHCFWIIALLVLILGFFTRDLANDTFDINIHDTYFIIAYNHTIVMVSLYYFLFGSCYWLLQKIVKKQLNRYLTLIHCIILFGSFLAYWTVVFYSNLIAKKTLPTSENYELINQTLVVLFLFNVFIGLPIYLINLLIGVFSKNSTSR